VPTIAVNATATVSPIPFCMGFPPLSDRRQTASFFAGRRLCVFMGM
jgi:hypothetical protein